MDKNTLSLIIIFVIAALIISAIITLTIQEDKSEYKFDDDIYKTDSLKKGKEEDGVKEVQEDSLQQEEELEENKTKENEPEESIIEETEPKTIDKTSSKDTQEDKAKTETIQGIVNKDNVLKTDNEDGEITTDDLKGLLDQL
ncbi:MAG TPA: hypothetical protein VJ900_01360 [Patescibacteria group bacterium]|nr:hypothetical protein [Patescibacteria group bacterium]